MKGCAAHFLQLLENSIITSADFNTESFRRPWNDPLDFALKIPDCEEPLLLLAACLRGSRNEPIEELIECIVKAILTSHREGSNGLDSFIRTLSEIYQRANDAPKSEFIVLMPQDYFILSAPHVYSEEPFPIYQEMRLPWGTVSFDVWAPYIEDLTNYHRPGWEQYEYGRFPKEIDKFAALKLVVTCRSAGEAHYFSMRSDKILIALNHIARLLANDRAITTRYGRLLSKVPEPPFIAIFELLKGQPRIIDRVYGPTDAVYSHTLLSDAAWQAWLDFLEPFYPNFNHQGKSIDRLLRSLELVGVALRAPSFDYAFLSLWCCLECISDAPNGQTSEVSARIAGLFPKEEFVQDTLTALSAIRNRLVHSSDWIGNEDHALRILLRITVRAIARLRAVCLEIQDDSEINDFLENSQLSAPVRSKRSRSLKLTDELLVTLSKMNPSVYSPWQ